jgi:phage tail sheath protein FI
MPEYLAPGVYVEEIERGPKPIEGVSTSTTAFLGETERGPTKPRLVTSYGEYLRIFGDVFTSATGDPKYLPYAVKSFFDNGGRRAYIARIAGAGGVIAKLGIPPFTITAVGPGAASNRTWVRIEPGSTTDASTNPLGFRLLIYYWDRAASNVPFDPVLDTTTLPRPSATELFDDLRFEADSPNYWDKRVNHGNSALVTLDVTPGTTMSTTFPATPPTVPPTPLVAPGPLAGGVDGATPGPAEYLGDDAQIDKRTGLSALALDPYRDIAIVAAPDAPGGAVKHVITHCQNNRYRFAVLDSQANKAVSSSLDPRSEGDIGDTKYAAFYYPWIWVSDPRSGARIKIPPSGSVCGIYALSDNTRGVWKAPANETIAGAIDLEYDVTHGEQEILNPRGVNVIRRFPGRGIRVWGARTLSSDPLWKYINVRRLFIFLEASIYNSTQWVVFEPNDPKLWARVKQTVTLFLRSQWREGALFGDKEEEAFSVAVGRETMTEDDILNGRLIIEIGIAPVRPAEFVIFRIYQKTSDAKE